MVHSLSQQGNTIGSSPSANMLSFGTPVGLGVEGITPSQLNMPTPNLGGVPMSLTMSDLGVTTSGSQKRNEEEERRARMRRVLKSIGKPKGRVSEEGIARVSRRVGFENDIDSYQGDERSRDVGSRSISIAGKKVVVDIVLKEQRPQTVQVMFDTENEGLAAQAEPIGKVLLDDLRVADGVGLHAKLDRFAANLERLAAIDRLSSAQINCFEALSGVYSSLRRLYEQETAAATDVEVTRTKSGKPAINARDAIGVDLLYWQNNRSATEAKDGAHENAIFGLQVDVERSAAGLYPSLRVSDNWLPDPLELPAPESGQAIPWQDPPPTLVTASAEGDAMAIDGDQKLPDVRFTAKLDPPVVLPWQLASTTMQLFGLPAPQLFVYPPAWHAMVLDPASTTPFNATNAQLVSTEQSVLTMRDGEEADITHTYMLDVPKPDGGYRLEKLPFSHPRQLVEILPTLRQWASFSSLIKQLFAGQSSMKEQAVLSARANGQAPISLDDLLTPPATPPFADKVPITVSIATSSIPTLSFTFPTDIDKPVASICVQVLPNAQLVVTSAEGVWADENASAMESVESEELKRMAKALEVCTDVGVWIEWLRSRVR